VLFKNQAACSNAAKLESTDVNPGNPLAWGDYNGTAGSICGADNNQTGGRRRFKVYRNNIVNSVSRRSGSRRPAAMAPGFAGTILTATAQGLGDGPLVGKVTIYEIERLTDHVSGLGSRTPRP